MEKMLSIRTAVLEDLPEIVDIYNYYVVHTPVTFDLQPFTVAARHSWFESYNQNDIHLLLVAELSNPASGEPDSIVGYASSSQFRVKPAYDQAVETTIYLATDHAGKGYGKKLYSELLNALGKTDIHRCYGVIALPNEASIALHQHFEFYDAGRLTEVGYKFNKYWDTLFMEKAM